MALTIASEPQPPSWQGVYLLSVIRPWIAILPISKLLVEIDVAGIHTVVQTWTWYFPTGFLLYMV